jgi:prolyl-tRNA synthetase
MKWSQTFIPTLKESPKEAEVPSHKLMLRCGLVQNLSSGLYIYLPLGKLVLDRINAVIRKVLGEHGAIELSMPALQPRSIWEKSGRWDAMADLMMRLTDREEREFVLGPTHEEIITDLVAKRINSYRQLPVNFYQIQTKFRDEIRPRFGVIRAKEFIMKDGYSFDMSVEDAYKSYESMYAAYDRIFKTCGIDVKAVEADTGVMGDGGRSHEFMAVTRVGEDVIVSCGRCGYAANLEMAVRKPAGGEEEFREPVPECEIVETPGVRTVEEVCGFFEAPPARLIKTLVYTADGEPVLILVRGDIDVNEVKLKRALGADTLALADAETTRKVTGAEVGFAGPIGLDAVKIVADTSVASVQDGITGANRTDRHCRHVMSGRDFTPSLEADIGTCREGDSCAHCGAPLSSGRGIEVGQVFYLGTKYSRKMGAAVLDSEGRETSLEMGCYGIGVSRTVAAIIECNHDEKGIIWPVTVAPYPVVITVLDYADEAIRAASLRLYETLRGHGVDVLLDDRLERAGFKFKDSELLGFPLRATLGKRTFEEGMVEITERRTRRMQKIPIDRAAEFLIDRLRALREELEGCAD